MPKDKVRYPPKAEVTGSNPVGCANDFNWLHDSSEGSGPWFVPIIVVAVASVVQEFRISFLSNFDNWKWAVNASKSMTCLEQNSKFHASVKQLLCIIVLLPHLKGARCLQIQGLFSLALQLMRHFSINTCASLRMLKISPFKHSSLSAVEGFTKPILAR